MKTMNYVKKEIKAEKKKMCRKRNENNEWIVWGEKKKTMNELCGERNENQ